MAEYFMYYHQYGTNRNQDLKNKIGKGLLIIRQRILKLINSSLSCINMIKAKSLQYFRGDFKALYFVSLRVYAVYVTSGLVRDICFCVFGFKRTS